MDDAASGFDKIVPSIFDPLKDMFGIETNPNYAAEYKVKAKTLGSCENKTLCDQAMQAMRQGDHFLLSLIIEENVPMSYEFRKSISQALMEPKLPRTKGRKESKDKRNTANITCSIFHWLTLRDGWPTDAAKERAGEILGISKKAVNNRLSLISDEASAEIAWGIENLGIFPELFRSEIMADLAEYGLGTDLKFYGVYVGNLIQTD